MIIHKDIATGKWGALSLAEQLGNVGSEIHRAVQWQNKDEALYKQAIARAFELLDLTIQDVRWKTRLKELTRVREALGDAVTGGKLYQSSLQKLDEYFTQFAIAARIKKFQSL